MSSTGEKDENKKEAPKSPAPKKRTVQLGLVERRRHPRFLLTREQFRETKSGKTFSVYDLSQSGLSLHVDTKEWKPGSTIPGVLNLHPDSIEINPRFIGYYGDRAALKIEALSTYSKSVLERNLHPKKLGESLKLVREKLPVADYWYHGSCNTDLLLKLASVGEVSRVEIFFANFYWSWNEASAEMRTGVCQSFGKDKREDLLLADEPVRLEMIGVSIDKKCDEQKVKWAKAIVEASPLDEKLKKYLINKFQNVAISD